MKVLTYIFHHKHYKEIQTSYNEAVGELESAYKIWAEHMNLPRKGNFKERVFVAEHISEIREIAVWIKTYADILVNKIDGLRWLYNKTGKSFVKELHYADFKFIADHAREIGVLQGYMETYNRYITTQKEAVERFLSSSSHTHSYDEIQRVALEREKITDIAATLSKAHSFENKYRRAWKCFSKGRNFDEIPLTELKTIDGDDFFVKESFLELYERDANLIMLVAGKSTLLPIDSFEKENIDQESELSILLSSRDISPIDNFHADISLENEVELKRAILDSVKYGVNFNFVDSFTISDFYKYRGKFDEIGVSFDEACYVKEQNLDAIKAYNKEKYGKSVVFISDYYEIVEKGSDINLYIDKYKQEQELRQAAKRIQRENLKGFISIFGSVDVETCELSLIIKIISSEKTIQVKNNELEEIERQRIEHERKLKEEEQRQQKIRNLKSCVSSWPQPSYSTLHCFSLYYYYPTTCGWDVDQRDWDIRNLIWNFKANPNKPQSSIEIALRHEQAMDKVIPLIKRVIQRYFGDMADKLTLVCIPSSKRIVTERRYKDFSAKLCSLTGMSNGYDYVNVLSEGEAKHLGGSAQAKYTVDNSYFKNRFVILFDDVITSGRSMENFKHLLEQTGATVIAGLSIGKTKHEPQFSHPIDNV